MAYEVWAAGKNQYYELGLGDATQRNTHEKIAGLWLVFRSNDDTTHKFSVGIKEDGTLWGVGDNSQKQLGLPNASYNTLTQIGSANDWVDVAVGALYTLVLNSSGSIYVCGSNSSGQGGQGNTTSPIATLTIVPGANVYTAIAANGSSSFGLRNDGKLYGWGAHGTLGLLGVSGTTSIYSSPTLVTTSANVASMSIGYLYGMAVLVDGHMVSWGTGSYGKRGSGGTTTSLYATQVQYATDWAKVFAGYHTTFAVKTDGTLWSFGYGGDYASAQGSTSDIYVPTQVGTDTDWIDAQPVFNGVLARKTSGAIHVCGNNAAGVLGTGNTTNVTALTDIGFNSPDGASGQTTTFAYNSSYLLTPAPVTPPDLIESPIELTVQLPANPPIEAPIELTVEQTAAYIEAPIVLAVVDMSSGLLDAPGWSARCVIDGIDVSALLRGKASSRAVEGAARIADITIDPPSGAFSPLAYGGKLITLDYVPILGGTPVPLRLFTGRIDTPEYDVATRLLRLSCVDDLQNRVAALPRTTLDAIIAGRWTAAVQGDPTDNWDYAQDRMATVAASLDASPSGGLRVTPWAGGAVWATFGSGQIIYPESAVAYPQRSTITNRVVATFEYRYPRLRQRYTSVGWSGTLIDMAPCGYQYPTQQDIAGAAGGSGWTVTAGIFWPAPASIPHSSGGFVRPEKGTISMAVLKLTQRHSQTITERYTLNVRAPESIASNGELPAEANGSLASAFDGQAWESALDVVPLMPDGGEQDYAPDALRADADYAIQTMIDMANAKILGSHRSTRISNATLCNPDIDLDKRVAIVTDDINAEGKVAEVLHTLDFDSGNATTRFAIACFGLGGAGIITPDLLVPPDPPAAAVETQDWSSEVPPLYVHTYGITPYAGNLMGLLLDPPESIFVEDVPGIGAKSYPNPFYTATGNYPVQGFRVQMPGVADADRNPIEKPVTASYDLVIPVDTLEITKP